MAWLKLADLKQDLAVPIAIGTKIDKHLRVRIRI